HPFLQGKLPQFSDAAPLPDCFLDRRGAEHHLMDGDTPLITAFPAMITATMHHESSLLESREKIRHIARVMHEIRMDLFIRFAAWPHTFFAFFAELPCQTLRHYSKES